MGRVRPQYETPTDRNREQSVAEAFEKHYSNVRLEKLPFGHHADFLAYRDGHPSAYIEVKTRKCTSTHYDTYHISATKMRHLLALAIKDDLTAVLVVKWKDRIGLVKVEDYLTNATYKEGGRWDRNDKYDVEEMAEAPISLFKFIGQ